jgi:hypothetical protein
MGRSTQSTPTTRGLPQGSSVSPLFAYGLLRPVLEEFERQHGSEALLFNYADNFVILAKTTKAMQASSETLKRLLSEHPAGPLTLTTKTAPRPLSQGINFLGYRIMRRQGCRIVSMRKDRKASLLADVRAEMTTISRIRNDSTRADRLSSLCMELTGRFAAYTAAPSDLEHVFRLLARWVFPLKSHPAVTGMMRTLAKVLAKLSRDELPLEQRSRRTNGPRVQLRLASDLLSVPRGYTSRHVQGLRFARTAASYRQEGERAAEAAT